MGRYQEAIEEVAAIHSPQRDLALYQLGGVLANQGEMEYARQAFRSVGRDSLYYVGSRLTAMDVSLAMGDPAGAREFGREALESVLTNSSVAGFIASATANLAEALKESRKILGTLPLLQQHSEYSAALYLLAKAAADLKDGGAALELLKASEDLPGGRRARPGTLDVEAEILRGEAYALLGDRSAARDRLTKASGAWAGPTADEARFLLADITLWDGNTEAAVAEYGALASGEPSSHIVNDALERIHVLSQLQPDVVPLYARAADFEWRGRYDDAVEEYRNLAARTVGSYVADWALYRVGRILFRTGKVEDAEKTWQVVAERTEDSLLKGRIAFETIERIEKTPGVSREEIDGRYRKLIEEMPDTIFADRARKRISS
jgi:tetratricopeptide (TPR) repeat protein